MLIEDTDNQSSFVVEIQDDGRVAHAYLKNPNGKIQSTVWLYNNSKGLPAPKDWKSLRRGDPPTNLSEYGGDNVFTPLNDPVDVDFDYEYNPDGTLESVTIYFREEPHAVLMPNEPIGWSVLASKEGPLAHVLERVQRGDGYWKLKML